MRLNIAGAFSKANNLRLYMTVNKKKLNEFQITVYDGINNCAWNGGRINRDIDYCDEMIDFYYRHNISIALTFTNPVIDLSDKTGNHLLEKFHKTDNVIISVNEDLRNYVQQNFPKYKHTRSITSFGSISIPMSDEDVDRYIDLETRYDFIVPRCEHVFDKRFSELNQDKYEIMLNDTCIYNCPFYGEHFEKIAEQNRLHTKPWEQGGGHNMYEIEECWLSERSTYKPQTNFDPDTGDVKAITKHGDSYGMDLKKSQIKQLISNGVRNFKITGREMTDVDFNNDIDLYVSMLMSQ